MAEPAVPVDPRLAALALADEILIEFPEGTIEGDVPVLPEVVPEVVPELAVPSLVPPEPAVAPPMPQVLELRLEPAPVAPPHLEESDVLLRATVVTGLLPRRAELSVEQLGFRLTGVGEVGIRWIDVTAVHVRFGRVRIRARIGTVMIALAIDGVAAPELSASFARVLEEARAGALDPGGSAVHALQNEMDALRDTFHESDDSFIPLAMGGALAALALVLTIASPEILAFLTRPSVPANAFVLGSRLAIFDPRVLALAVSVAATVTAVAARAALGAHAASWARGTLRGWHVERPSPLAHLRKMLAVAFLYPAAASAVAAICLAIAVPSARSHATVGQTGIQIVRPLPFLDRAALWTAVEEIVALAATGSDHPQGLAALIRGGDGSTIVSTLDLPLRNSTDRYFLELTRKWHAQANARSSGGSPGGTPGSTARSR